MRFARGISKMRRRHRRVRRLTLPDARPTNSCLVAARAGGWKVDGKEHRMDAIAAVVLAAGKGTRMKSDRAKVLHQACGRPLAYFPIRAAFALDCAPVVAVVGHQADLVEKELSQLFPGAPLEFARQKDQLGTGHAVVSAQAALKRSGFSDRGNVLLLCGDAPLVTAETLQRLVRVKREARAPLALILTRPAGPRG